MITKTSKQFKFLLLEKFYENIFKNILVQKVKKSEGFQFGFFAYYLSAFFSLHIIKEKKTTTVSCTAIILWNGELQNAS